MGFALNLPNPWHGRFEMMGGACWITAQAAVGAAAAHHLETAMPGVGKVECKADTVGEMIGILRAGPLVDDADDVAITRLLGRAQDLGVRQRKSRKTRAGRARGYTGYRYRAG